MSIACSLPLSSCILLLFRILTIGFDLGFFKCKFWVFVDCSFVLGVLNCSILGLVRCGSRFGLCRSNFGVCFYGGCLGGVVETDDGEGLCRVSWLKWVAHGLGFWWRRAMARFIEGW